MLVDVTSLTGSDNLGRGHHYIVCAQIEFPYSGGMFRKYPVYTLCLRKHMSEILVEDIPLCLNYNIKIK
jgi:hypothetical protein